MLSNHELKAIFDGLTGKDKSEKIDPLTNKLVSAKSNGFTRVITLYERVGNSKGLNGFKLNPSSFY